MNLNEDPMLSKKIVFNLENENQIRVGRFKSEGTTNQITINGVNIQQNHAIFMYNMEDRTLFLKCQESEAAENTFVNGQSLLFYNEEEESDEGTWFVKEL